MLEFGVSGDSIIVKFFIVKAWGPNVATVWVGAANGQERQDNGAS